MNTHDFDDDSTSLEGTEFSDAQSTDEDSDDDEKPESTKRLDKRRRLEDFLEEKRLRTELDEYDDYLSNKGSDYDDALFNDLYRNRGYEDEDN